MQTNLVIQFFIVYLHSGHIVFVIYEQYTISQFLLFFNNWIESFIISFVQFIISCELYVLFSNSLVTLFLLFSNSLVGQFWWARVNYFLAFIECRPFTEDESNNWKPKLQRPFPHWEGNTNWVNEQKQGPTLKNIFQASWDPFNTYNFKLTFTLH